MKAYCTIVKARFVRAAAMAVAVLLIGSSTAQGATILGFNGPYDVSNWTLINDNADGSVDAINAPDSLTIVGGDSGSGDFGITDFYITAAAEGTVSFDWVYNSDDKPDLDLGLYFHGVYVVLSGTDGTSGSVSFNVLQGEGFGFSVATFDNLFGRGYLTITNFSAPIPDVPEPSLLLLTALGAVGLRTVRIRRRR